ncbi:hypothetical protein FRC03_002121 [Tulasnella sp. 419]|nr:hypothetical protein FRC03_002121 [Tulasnella sp. 419]
MVRTIVITGASRGLGLEFTKQYVAQSDTHVIAVARNPENSNLLNDLAKSSGRVHIVKADVANEQSIKEAVPEIEKFSNGTIDLLINNAAVNTNPKRELTEETVEGIEHEFHVNVTGPILFTNAVLPLMKNSKEKRVVFVTSESGIMTFVDPKTYAFHSPIAAYSISKAGLNMAARKYAVQFGNEGFTIIALCPGWAKTGKDTKRKNMW